MAATTQAPSTLIDINEVSRRLGISQRTAYRLLTAGDLPAPVYVRAARRWRSTDIDAYIASLPAADGADQ